MATGVRQQGGRAILLQSQRAVAPQHDGDAPQGVGATRRELLFAERVDAVLPGDVHVAAEAEEHAVALREVDAAAILRVQERQLP